MENKINDHAVAISKREGGAVNLAIAQISEVCCCEAEIVAEEMVEHDVEAAQTPTMLMLCEYATEKATEIRDSYDGE